MTRYAHQSSYASFGTRTNPEADKIDHELYEAGRAWGLAGNVKVPRWYPLDRGNGHVTQIPIVGSIGGAAAQFVRGWKETKPLTSSKKKRR